MSRRRLAGLGLAAALAVTAATAAGTTLGATNKVAASSITVWLQTDAQAANWAPIVAGATAQFHKDHPGVNVNVQYQTWPTHLQKFDATLAGGNTPDVIEMGNTEMTKYMAAGAFQDLTSDKSKFDNSGTWLAGLAASGRYAGKLFGVPYYAARASSRTAPISTRRPESASRRRWPTSPLPPASCSRSSVRRASHPSTSPAPTGTSP